MQTSSSDASLISDKSSTSTDTQSAATRSTASSSSSSLVSTIPVSVPDPEAGKSAAATTTTTTGAAAAAAAPAKKHRSVRSLTREYETQTSEAASADGPTAFPLSSSPPSASSSANSLSPIRDRERRPSAGSFSSAHSRKPSVLLASPSYPSTLAVNEPHAHYQRQRTISGNSIRSNSGELARTPSVRLASPNYPSTFQQQQTSPTSPPQSVQPLPTRPSVTTSLSADSLSNGALSSSTSMSATPSGRSTPMMHRRKKSSKDINLANGDASGHDMLPTLSVSFDGSDEQLDENGAAGYDNDDKKVAAMHDDDDEAMDGLGELSDNASPKKAMSAAERRDHSRKHSRVHSRNLSVFFPRPGSEAEREADEIRANDNFDRQPHRIQTTGLVAQDTSSSGSSTSEGSALTANGLTVPLDDVGVPVSPTKSRRGHHRKHSVNHALFDGAHLQVGRGASDIPLNDLSTPSTAASPWTAFSFYDASDEPAHQHHHHPHHHHDAHTHSHTHEHANDKVAAAFPSSSSLHAALSEPLWASLPASHRPLFVFGLSHFALGAALWVSGQSGDSLSMTGLGYLVVFDALGILSSCGAEWFGESWKRQRERKALKRGAKRDHSSSRVDELRRPYGSHRVETLLYFVQSIYLLFASVYVCKESIEHALLEGSEEHHEEDDVGLVLPTVMLVLATAVSLFSNLVLHNHAKLVAACGISTAASEAASSSPLSARSRRRGHGRAGSVLVDPKALAGPFLHLISNPFSLTVLFFSTVLALASIIMPPFQVAALDKVLAGMESAAMAYVAWPASKALGKVLLQTAPSVVAPLNVHLNRTIKTIEDHRLVTYVAPPNLWQLTPPTSALSAGAAVGLGSSANGNIAHASPSKLTSILPASSGLVGGAGASRTAKHAALVATLKIFIKDEATDDDVLDVTRWAWQLAAPSVGAGAGLKPGDTLRGSIRAGELIVEVQREGARDRFLASAKDKYGGHHHHHHDHEHHGHGHSHEHDDHHHQDHHHDHGHSHGHDHHHDHAGHSHSSHAHHSHSHHDHSAHGHNGHSHHHDHSQPSHSEHQHSPHSHSHHHEDNHLHAAVPISTGPQHQQHLHNNHSHHH